MGKVAWKGPEAEKGYRVSVQYGTSANRAETPAENTEFERFENLAGKLVSVPKSELDEQRARSDS